MLLLLYENNSYILPYLILLILMDIRHITYNYWILFFGIRYNKSISLIINHYLLFQN
jgi:hypothetical protein